MGRSRGGQRKHWAEEARVQAWYAEIKRRCNWSDYMLDQEFAWTEEGRKFRSTDNRPRTFEWIRKAARKPRGIDKRWRSMDELVLAVEQSPQFKGTQALYEAEIWNLLQEVAPAPDAVQDRIDRLSAANRLMRMPVENAFEKGGALANEFELPQLFECCLRISLRRMDRLSGIALVWCLYLQTEPPHNARIRAVVEAIADKLLDHFFADYLPDRYFDYYDDAIGVLFQTRLDLSTRGISGYGFIETLGTWPVVPEDLAGKLTEKHLMPKIWIGSFGGVSVEDS